MTNQTRKNWGNILRAYRIQEHFVVSVCKLLKQHTLKAHRQNVNSTIFKKSIAKVSGLQANFISNVYLNSASALLCLTFS